jgi:hypothetical protein
MRRPGRVALVHEVEAYVDLMTAVVVLASAIVHLASIAI